MEESTEKSKAEQNRFFNWLLRLQQYAVEEGRRRSKMAEAKFKVGDRVWLNANERGTIVRFCTNEETCIVNSDIEGEVEMRTDALEKIEDSAINPAHYQVDGIPEAIEIMEHLMTKEQLEGFLWGNIIKYAYRYGRKGDKAETAGKIAWYANQLKAVEERGDGE